MSKHPQNYSLEEAIAMAGSASELARIADVSPQVINNARRRGSVSTDLALKIERATGVDKSRLVWGTAQRNKAA